MKINIMWYNYMSFHKFDPLGRYFLKFSLLKLVVVFTVVMRVVLSDDGTRERTW